jgi:hypothetical protein
VADRGVHLAGVILLIGHRLVHRLEYRRKGVVVYRRDRAVNQTSDVVIADVGAPVRHEPIEPGSLAEETEQIARVRRGVRVVFR